MRKRRVWYYVWNPDYKRVTHDNDKRYISTGFQNYENARTLDKAIKLARRMGPGTEIVRNVLDKNGKFKKQDILVLNY